MEGTKTWNICFDCLKRSHFCLRFSRMKNIKVEIKFCWSNKLNASDGFLPVLSRCCFPLASAFKRDELKKCCRKLLQHSFLSLSATWCFLCALNFNRNESRDDFIFASNFESLYQVSIKHKKCNADCSNSKLVETWFYCTFLLYWCWRLSDCVLWLVIIRAEFRIPLWSIRFIRHLFHAKMFALYVC